MSLEIGRPIGKQESKIVINTDSFNNMSRDVNILRKPHFDERQFDVIQDQSGYYISLNEQELFKNLTINDLPWMISNYDEAEVDSGTYERYVKIYPGTWTIQGYKTLSNIDITNSDPKFNFIQLYNGTSAWNCLIEDGETVNIYVGTYNNTTNTNYLDCQYPTDLVLLTTVTSALSTQNTTRLIGTVTNNYGVLFWTQNIEGDIYSTTENYALDSVHVYDQTIIPSTTGIMLELGGVGANNSYIDIGIKDVNIAQTLNNTFGTFRLTCRAQAYLDSASTSAIFFNKVELKVSEGTLSGGTWLTPTDVETLWHIVTSGDLYTQLYCEHIRTINENDAATWYFYIVNSCPCDIIIKSVQVTIEKISYR